jgi:ATP-binding cassette subfamily B protein
MYSINLVVLFTLVVYQMIAISPVLTALVLIPLPIMSYLIYKVSAKMNLLSKKVQEEQSLLSTIAQESFSGMRVIKAYSQQKSVGDKFENAANMYKSKSMRLVVVNALFIPTILFLIGLSTLLSIYIGGNMSFNNEISLGGIVAFIFFVNNLTWPFASIGWVTSLIQRAAASQQRINEFLSVKTNTNEVIEDTLFKFENEISFNNVSYTYQNTGIHAIKNISFVIPKGETFAIIGKTGSGKSTILSLLLRQLNPNSGAIKLDTCNFDKIETNGFKNALGVVPQEVFLFSDSIGNNIKFGSNNPIVSKERLDEVCETADILNTINKLEDGYETILGERGVNLSGGQKQRLSIARALLRSPEILVLDDCLSAVDTETEDKILKELQKEKTSRTTIIVSHRISTIRNAKHIIVIDDGSVIEQGSHAVLLKNKGFYYDLYKKQQTDLKNNEDRKKPL